MAKVTHLGSAKPDSPIYKTGPVIGGKRFTRTPKKPKPQPILRFTSGGYGGNYGYRFAGLVAKWAGGSEDEIIRDWSVREFAYIIISRRPVELILSDIEKSEDTSTRLEILTPSGKWKEQKR